MIYLKKGSCLCGVVQYQITGHLDIYQYCHCSRCRKFTGSAFAPNLLVKPEHFEWLCGAESVGRYEVKNAKHFATGFCRHCGSSLPWLSQSKKVVIIPTGTLDDDPQIEPNNAIYLDSKASWLKDASKLVQFDQLPTKKSTPS